MHRQLCRECHSYTFSEPYEAKVAHNVKLAQGEALRAIEAASSKATVGSAYGMAPAYPKTDSEADRAATAGYWAMNNLYFLNPAMAISMVPMKLAG